MNQCPNCGFRIPAKDPFKCICGYDVPEFDPNRPQTKKKPRISIKELARLRKR